MTLNKRAPRSIKNNISFYVVSTILTLLSSMFIVTAVSTGRTLVRVVEDFMDRYNVEDAEFITYNPISQEDISKLESEYDVSIEQSRYKDIKYDDTTIRIFDAPDKMNLYDVRDGHEPGAGEALITENYADEHGIKVGDKVGAYTISGFTTKSDYLYMIESLSGGYRDNAIFGIMIVNHDEYLKADGDEITYYSVVYNDKDKEKDFRKAINNDYVINSYLSGDVNTRISMPASQGRDVTRMALIITPIIFIIVIALIVMVMGRRIRSEQPLLGTFRALGLSRGRIIGHYIMYALIPGIIGSVVGLAVTPFTVKICTSFYIDFDFEKLIYNVTYDVPSVITALVVPSLLYSLVVIITSARLLKKSPVELLRRTGNDDKSVGIMKKSNASTSAKLRIRSLLGHPGRSIVTVLGVCIASICIFAGLMMKDGMDDIVNNGVTDSVKYKYLYVLNTLGNGTSEEGEALFRSYYEVDGSVVQLSVQGVEPGTKYFSGVSDITDDKCILTSAASETYGVKAGDDFTFYSIADLTEHTVKVTDVINDNAHSYLYMTRQKASELAGLDGNYYNCIISGEEVNVDENIVSSKIEMQDTVETIKGLMSPMNGIIMIFEVLGIILCIFILYLIMNMITQENRNNIAVMKVLGFSRRQIAGRTLKVNHFLVIIGYLLSIPASYAIVKIGYADTIENFGMLMTPVITVRSVILALVILWAAYELALLLQYRKIKKLDMVSALKESNVNE